MSYRVQVGDNFMNFVIRETTAPRNLDSWSTLTIDKERPYGGAGRTTRVVAIEESNFEWQERCYASGGYSSDQISETRERNHMYEFWMALFSQFGGRWEKY